MYPDDLERGRLVGPEVTYAVSPTRDTSQVAWGLLVLATRRRDPPRKTPNICLRDKSFGPSLSGPNLIHKERLQFHRLLTVQQLSSSFNYTYYPLHPFLQHIDYEMFHC